MQLLGGELGLQEVAVDLVTEYHLPLGRLSGLTGAEHDLDVVVAERLADVPAQAQPCVVGLHHHVQKDERGFGVSTEEIARFFTRVGVVQRDPAVFEGCAREQDSGDFMDGGVVVDD